MPGLRGGEKGKVSQRAHTLVIRWVSFEDLVYNVVTTVNNTTVYT